MEFAVESSVVVGEGVEAEVLDEPVEGDRHRRSPCEVLVDHAVVHGEDPPGEFRALTGLGLAHLLHPVP